MSLLTYFTIFVLLAIVMLIAGWFYANYKAKQFNKEYNYISNLVKKSNASSLRDFKFIEAEFDKLHILSENDEILKKALWSDVLFKFRDILPYWQK